MPHSSPYPSITIPEVDVFTLLFSRPSRPFPDTKELLTDGERPSRSYTLSQLRDAATEFGKGLKALWGWKRGDVLAFYTPNDVDTPALTFGALWAGGVVSPANPLYTADELAFQLTNSGAKAIVTQAAYLKTAREAAARAGIPEDRVILLGEKGDPEGRFRHWSSIKPTAYCSLYAKTEVRPKKDLALLVYSSGTTGLPKGVCLTHFNVVCNLLQNSALDGHHLRPGPGNMGDRLLGVIPFYHVYGMANNILFSVYSGLQLVIMSRFDLEKACQAIQDFKITYAYVPPPVVLALGKNPAVDKYDLTTLKYLHCGAAPLPSELIDLVWSRLKVAVKQGYGLSEVSAISHAQMPEEWAKFKTSVGKLAPNMQAKVVDTQGNEVTLGEEGELWLKGPNIFGGYLNNPERTKEAFTTDQWLKTGDVVKMDKYGNYYCVDRLKELIKYKGFQVAPAELEGLMVGHQDVTDACVIGVYDPSQATELPRAYVVLKAGVARSEAKAEEISAWMATKVAPHKRLRGGLYFIDVVPKSPSGKILRRLLRDKIRQDEKKAGPRL
ncbi:putative 4-coumarate--CoA ligase 1 [Cytospora mali]|uniref:4-coumarate--CoA ligase 1 n=1 Tax=Cytospora mali TaxID=578113 RepID=A0A194UR32_CYTMA|nr:putative 4-coumarate--CoA ligase 1 [Valsa mali var. pyri (nom. inval.)]